MKMSIVFWVTCSVIAVSLFYLPFDFTVPVKVSSRVMPDTGKVVYDSLGKPLRYSQFMPILKTGAYTIEPFNRQRRLVKTSQSKWRSTDQRMDTASINQRVAMIFKSFFPEKKSLALVDTSQLLYDEMDKPLRFFQYSELMASGKYQIEVVDGHKRLKTIHPRILQDFTIDDPVFPNNQLFSALTWADKIMVLKSKRKLFIMRNGKALFEYPVNLGKNPTGQKLREGDDRTPEGTYFIDWEKYDNPPYYRSFHISYPNELDKERAKKNGFIVGSNIMIHGTGPTKVGLKDWTNGCVAVRNFVLDTLSKYTPLGTAIEIKP